MGIVHRYPLIFSLLPVILGAIFSFTYMHPDEHYQILELVHLKTSNWYMPEILNWDYHEKIRPWFQPFVYSILSWLNPIKDPYFLSFLIRLFNGLLGWFSIYFLLRKFSDKEKYKENLLWYFWIWYIPFLFVRTNSESFSTSFFILGAVLFFSESRPRRYLSAPFWAFSFLCRYQMGVCVLFAHLWRLVKEKNLPQFILHSIVLLLLVATGFLFDYWGYGSWEFSPWNYLRENVIAGRASHFGVDPIWFYFKKVIVKGIPPLSLVLLGACLYYFYKKKMCFWTWVCVPFVLVHFAIPHKEMRFLNFVYFLVPFFLIKLKEENLWNPGEKWQKYFIKPGFIISAVITIPIIVTSGKPIIKLHRHVYTNSINRLFAPQNHDGHYFKFKMPFYLKERVETVPFKLKEGSPPSGDVITVRYHHYKVMKTFKNCQSNYQIYPDWISKVNVTGWLKRSSFFVIWKCKKT